MQGITARVSDGAAQGTMIPSPSDEEFSIHSIEAAIAYAPEHRRADHARRVTELFVAGASVYSDRNIAVFDRVLQKLIAQIGAAVLAEIGVRLAPIDRSPLGVMRVLANHDEIAVAGPVLTRFAPFPAADLRAIAETKSQAHLMALCGRSRLEEAVTDVLVERGSREVVCTLAANEGAKFSDSGMTRLAERGGADEAIAENVVRRADLPHHVFCQLLVVATSTVRERLLAIVDPVLRAEACRVLDKVAGEIADDAPAPRSYGAAIRRVLLDSARGELGEDDLIYYATNNDVEETIAALSLLSAVPTEKIEQVVTRAQYDSLFLICKAAGLTWAGTRAVVLLNRPRNAVRPDALAELQERYEKIEPSQANRIVRIWSLNG